MISKNFVDIKYFKTRKEKRKLNLAFRKVITIPLKSLIQTTFIFLVILSFAFGLTIAPASGNVRAAQNNKDEQKILEAKLADYENQISEYEKTISQYKAQGRNLQSEIRRLDSQIAKLNLQIRAVNLNLNKLDAEIVVTEKQINQTEDEINLNRKNLSQLLQSLYEKDKTSLVEILFKNPQLSDFFGDLNNLMNIQNSLRVVIEEIIEARQKLVDQKEVLALEKMDAVSLKAHQDAQKASITKVKGEKNTLLRVTRGKESEYQKILVETRKTAAEIRKQIFRLIGGGELKFEEAYRLAKMAEESVGVRAALLLAVLDIESDFGRNVGRCNYKTAMHPRRDIPIFLKIIRDLREANVVLPEPIMVSCPNPDGPFGGAMGPTQFIPSTWAGFAGYEKINGVWGERDNSRNRIGQITGSNPPNPWNNVDAFTATALYLRDLGAGRGVSLAKEKEAAARYYAGSRWRRHLHTYGARVISQAQRFERDIAILGS